MILDVLLLVDSEACSLNTAIMHGENTNSGGRQPLEVIIITILTCVCTYCR